MLRDTRPQFSRQILAGELEINYLLLAKSSGIVVLLYLSLIVAQGNWKILILMKRYTFKGGVDRMSL